MSGEENASETILFPTKSKTQIGSFLSWPIGAMALSKSLANVPQAKHIELWFHDHWPKWHQGKYPAHFSVVEATYSRSRNVHLSGEFHWRICVRPVPRSMRAKIKGDLEVRGMKLLSEWFCQTARYSGQEGNISWIAMWSLELEQMTFANDESLVPKVSTDAFVRGQEAKASNDGFLDPRSVPRNKSGN